MKELEFLFYKLPPERQAIAIDLIRALIDPTVHNDRNLFSRNPSSSFVTGDEGRETTELVMKLNTWDKDRRFVVSRVLK